MSIQLCDLFLYTVVRLLVLFLATLELGQGVLWDPQYLGNFLPVIFLSRYKALIC